MAISRRKFLQTAAAAAGWATVGGALGAAPGGREEGPTPAQRKEVDEWVRRLSGFPAAAYGDPWRSVEAKVAGKEFRKQLGVLRDAVDYDRKHHLIGVHRAIIFNEASNNDLRGHMIWQVSGLAERIDGAVDVVYDIVGDRRIFPQDERDIQKMNWSLKGHTSYGTNIQNALHSLVKIADGVKAPKQEVDPTAHPVVATPPEGGVYTDAFKDVWSWPMFHWVLRDPASAKRLFGNHAVVNGAKDAGFHNKLGFLSFARAVEWNRKSHGLSIETSASATSGYDKIIAGKPFFSDNSTVVILTHDNRGEAIIDFERHSNELKKVLESSFQNITVHNFVGGSNIKKALATIGEVKGRLTLLTNAHGQRTEIALSKGCLFYNRSNKDPELSMWHALRRYSDNNGGCSRLNIASHSCLGFDFVSGIFFAGDEWHSTPLMITGAQKDKVIMYSPSRYELGNSRNRFMYLLNVLLQRDKQVSAIDMLTWFERDRIFNEHNDPCLFLPVDDHVRRQVGLRPDKPFLGY